MRSFFLPPTTRGQASMEFMLVLIFMLVVVSGIIVPLGQRMQGALEDVSIVGSASAALKRIQTDVNILVASPGDSLQIVSLYIPKGSRLLCDPLSETISFTIPLNRDVFDTSGNAPPNCVDNLSPPPGTPQMVCTHVYRVPPSADLQCQGDATNGFSIDTGAAGFAQTFRIGSVYNSTATPPFVIDFNSG